MTHPIALIAGVTFKEGIRNRALHGILAISLLLCLAFLTVLPMFAFDTGKVAVDLGFASMTLAGLAIVIFLGIALLTRDVHQRTVCMILSRPVSRTDYVIGKYVGLALTLLMAVAGIAALSVATTWLGVRLFIEVDPPRNFSWTVLGMSVFFHYLSLLMLMAVAFFFASLTTSEFLSMLFTFCVYLIGNTLETIVTILQQGEFARVGPLYMATLNVLTWLFPNLSAFDLKVYIAYGLDVPWNQVAWTAAYGCVYICLLAVLTLMIFRRREIT